MNLRILVCALSLTVFSCGTVTQEKKAGFVPTYEMKTFRFASADGCVRADSCAIFDVTYPQFAGVDDKTANRIQREIELIFSMGDPEAEEKSLQQIAKEFVDNYEQFSTEMGDFGRGWFYEGKSTVNVVLDTLISITFDEEYYTGGAHGGSGKYFLNIDPRTGKIYVLDDFFIPGYELTLNMLGEKEFRRTRELADTANLQYNYFEFPDNKFQLNRNFGFTADGVMFYFNNYEIAPYAAGPTAIFIPFEKIKGWLKTEPAAQT